MAAGWNSVKVTAGPEMCAFLVLGMGGKKWVSERRRGL